MGTQAIADVNSYLKKGLVAHARHDLDSASHFYEIVLKIDPDCITAMGWLGTIEAQKRNFSRAKSLLEEAIKLSGNTDFLSAYANLLQETGFFEQALIIYTDLSRLGQGTRDPILLSNLSACCNSLLQSDKALYWADRALVHDSTCWSAWLNRGASLHELRRFEEALSSYERATDLNPTLAEAWSSRGNTLRELRQYENAILSCEVAIGIKADMAAAWLNLGASLQELKNHEKALSSYSRAIKLKPLYAEAWNNQGVALNDLLRFEDALSSYEKAVELKPDYAEAIYNKALSQLTQKKFSSGFKNYRWRLRTAAFKNSRERLLLDFNDSYTSTDSSLLLWAEQGLGDEIFYARFISSACEKYANVCLVADKRLHPMFSRSLPCLSLLDRKESRLIKAEDLNNRSQGYIGDLPFILGITDTRIDDFRGPFLFSDKNRREGFRLNMPFNTGKIICGISWESSNKNIGADKSISLAELVPTIGNELIEFVNLQYGDISSSISSLEKHSNVRVHQIQDLDLFQDVDGLTALIDACDIVITTSSVTAHLAGSIGKKGCVLVPFSRGRMWYWHWADAVSFWYPSLRLFYQRNASDWTEVLKEVKEYLHEETDNIVLHPS